MTPEQPSQNLVKKNQIVSTTPFPHDQISVKDKEKIEKDLERWQELRQKILEAIPSGSEDMNMERVEEFVSLLGLTLKEFIVLPSDKEVDLLYKLFEQYDYLKEDSNYNKNWAAMQDSFLNLILIHEEGYLIESTFHSEVLLIHELAHGSSGYLGCIVVKPEGRSQEDLAQGEKTEMPRAGFAIGKTLETTQGYFMEEGFAELLAGMYAEKYMPTSMKKKILFSSSHKTENNVDDLIYWSNEVHLPAKYFSLTLDGVQTLRDSNIAGYGIELLCKKILCFSTHF